MGTPQCRPGGQSPIKPRRPVRRARRVAKHSTSHTNRGHRYVEPTRQANVKHDTEPLCAGRCEASAGERISRKLKLVVVSVGKFVNGIIGDHVPCGMCCGNHDPRSGGGLEVRTTTSSMRIQLSPNVMQRSLETTAVMYAVVSIA